MNYTLFQKRILLILLAIGVSNVTARLDFQLGYGGKSTGATYDGKTCVAPKTESRTQGYIDNPTDQMSFEVRSDKNPNILFYAKALKGTYVTIPKKIDYSTAGPEKITMKAGKNNIIRDTTGFCYTGADDIRGWEIVYVDPNNNNDEVPIGRVMFGYTSVPLGSHYEGRAVMGVVSQNDIISHSSDALDHFYGIDRNETFASSLEKATGWGAWVKETRFRVQTQSGDKIAGRLYIYRHPFNINENEQYKPGTFNLLIDEITITPAKEGDSCEIYEENFFSKDATIKKVDDKLVCQPNTNAQCTAVPSGEKGTLNINPTTKAITCSTATGTIAATTGAAAANSKSEKTSDKEVCSSSKAGKKCGSKGKKWRTVNGKCVCK